MKSAFGETLEAVGYRLKRAQHALRTHMDTVLKPLGLSAPSYAVLAAVERTPGLSNAALARLAFVTPQTMQGMVASLERAGLLVRHPDPRHGRILTTQLTEAGMACVGRARALVDRIEAEMVDGLEPDRIADLVDLLAHCTAKVEALASR